MSNLKTMSILLLEDDISTINDFTNRIDEIKKLDTNNRIIFKNI